MLHWLCLVSPARVSLIRINSPLAEPSGTSDNNQVIKAELWLSLHGRQFVFCRKDCGDCTQRWLLLNSQWCGNAVAAPSLAFLSGSCPAALEQFFSERRWWNETERHGNTWSLGISSVNPATARLPIADVQLCRLCSYGDIAVIRRQDAIAGVLCFPILFLYLCLAFGCFRRCWSNWNWNKCSHRCVFVTCLSVSLKVHP